MSKKAEMFAYRFGRGEALCFTAGEAAQHAASVFAELERTREALHSVMEVVCVIANAEEYEVKVGRTKVVHKRARS